MFSILSKKNVNTKRLCTFSYFLNLKLHRLKQDIEVKMIHRPDATKFDEFENRKIESSEMESACTTMYAFVLIKSVNSSSLTEEGLDRL